MNLILSCLHRATAPPQIISYVRDGMHVGRVRASMPRILLVAAAAIAAAVAVPSVAHGATVHQDGRTPDTVLLKAEPARPIWCRLAAAPAAV
ncbi:MAG: hypothetical protein ACRDPC_05925 [Solirubrobacteraceae bacterium]